MIRPINIIAACAVETRVIGREGKMPWNLPIDLKYFKARTENQIVIMGRKTYESIGKPLPNRINIVITNNMDFKKKIARDPNVGVCIVSNLSEAIKQTNGFKDKEVFVIGGGQVYADAIKCIIDKIYITWVGYKEDGLIEGDTFFPELPPLIDKIDEYSYREDENFDLTFTTYSYGNSETSIS